MRFFARRLFLVGAVLAALAMLMAPALAGADDDGGGGGDRAFCAPAGPPEPGQCMATGVFNRLDFDARSGPGGENPTGTFRFDFNVDDFVEGQVTCLHVTGNLAFFGGTITDSSFSFLVGQGTGVDGDGRRVV